MYLALSSKWNLEIPALDAQIFFPVFSLCRKKERNRTPWTGFESQMHKRGESNRGNSLPLFRAQPTSKRGAYKFRRIFSARKWGTRSERWKIARENGEIRKSRWGDIKLKSLDKWYIQLYIAGNARLKCKTQIIIIIIADFREVDNVKIVVISVWRKLQQIIRLKKIKFLVIRHAEK